MIDCVDVREPVLELVSLAVGNRSNDLEGLSLEVPLIVGDVVHVTFVVADWESDKVRVLVSCERV